MDVNQVIERLKESNRAAVARATGLNRTYLDRLVRRKIKDPGTSKMDTLRAYFGANPPPDRPQ